MEKVFALTRHICIGMYGRTNDASVCLFVLFVHFLTFMFNFQYNFIVLWFDFEECDDDVFVFRKMHK